MGSQKAVRRKQYAAKRALPKKWYGERDKLILGARAPSPAVSAKRETVTASRSLRLRVLRRLVRARAPALPVLTCFVTPTTFWARLAKQVTLLPSAYCRLPSFLRLTACQILKVFNAGPFCEGFQTELDEELF